MKNSTSRLGKWTRIVESDKVRVKAGMGHKVVLIPKDSRTLDIKIVNDADVLTADQKLTPSGFTAIVNFIKQQPSVINNYPGLNDLTTNLVVYTVSQDSSRKQLITFTIGSKAEIGGINSAVKYVRQDELELAKTGAILNTGETAAIQAATSKATFTVPVASSSIKDSADSKLITWMKETYRKIMKDPIAAANPIMAKIKKELGANKLGNDSPIFVMGLNGGYGIYDWSGEDLETGITQKLLDKVAMTPAVLESSFYIGVSGHRLVEELSTTVVGFDPDKFNAEITRAQAEAELDTGGIKVPAEGFKYGLRGDAEFKKFQEILVKYLPTYSSGALANVGHVKNFVAAVPMVGDYGDKTKALIQFLKAGLIDPKYPDNDAQVIKSDFVNRLLKEFGQVTESKTYISLDGSFLILEGFDVAAGTAVAGTGTVAVKKKKKSSGGGGGSTAASSEIYYLQTMPEWEYKLVSERVHTRKKGSSGTFFKGSNAASIKAVATKANAAGKKVTFDLYVKGSDKKWKLANDGYGYRWLDGKWKVWLNNAWEATIPATTTKLQAFYGTGNPFAYNEGSATVASSGTGATTAEIDKALIAVGTAIKTFVESSDTFSAYKGWNDDEGNAWDEVLKPEYDNNWKKTIDGISTKVKNSTAIKETDKKRYRTSIDTLRAMFTDDSYMSDETFRNKFYGATGYDTYDLKLLLAGSAVKRISIDTDF
jgi:hypothetical protein